MGGRDGLPQKYILVLQSTMPGKRASVANSDMAQTILRAKGIEPVVLDASDPQNKERRDRLFEFSGLRGNYPQLFKVEGKETTFLGGFDALQAMNEDGTLAELSASVSSSADVGSEQPPIPVRVDSTNPPLESDGDSADEEEATPDEEEDGKDDSLETISVNSKRDIENDGEAEPEDEKRPVWIATLFGKRRKDEAVDQKSNASPLGDQAPIDDDAGVTTAMREFGERKKIEDAKKYQKMIRILVIAVCLFLIMDSILIVLIILK
jgi:hypothetical protein